MAIDTAHMGGCAQRLYDYWNARRAARRWPSRASIAPDEFAFALGRVSLVDCVGVPPRFRYRVVSTGLTEQLGYEMTGRFTEQIPEPELRSYVEALYTRVWTEGEPFHDRGAMMLDGRQWAHETLVLPLSGDDVRVDMLLVYRDARATPPRRVFRPATARRA